MSFPKDFLWGGDISAAQIEGAWDQDGKSPTEVDYLLGGDKDTMRYAYCQNSDGTISQVMQQSGQLPKGAKYIFKEDAIYPNHFASGFYHHYKDDIALLGEMGFKALNLTISWARILPQGIKGGINQEGITYYQNILNELRKYHIKAVVVLYKYDMPAFFLEELGGWSNRALIDEYVAFCKICMEEYQLDVKHWITFNELNVLKFMYDMNPNSKKEEAKRVFAEEHNQLIASSRVVQMGHQINNQYQIGCMVCGLFTYPYTCDPLDIALAQKIKQDNMFFFSDIMMRGKYPDYAQRVFKEYDIELSVSEEDALDLQKGKVDFLAFSYYSSSCVTVHDIDKGGRGNLFNGVQNPYLNASQWGWTIDSQGLKTALHELNDRYQKPLFIVENGLGAIDQLEADFTVHDPYRIEYHKQHIHTMKEAIEEGVNLVGYTMWSCIDLVSFTTGEMKKRYGFVYVDINDEGKGTGKRYKKDSFYYYQKVCQTNGEEY